MKIAAIAILLLGLFMTMYSGFTFVTKEKVIDLGEHELTIDDHHAVMWEPYVGLGVMLLGVLMLVPSVRKRQTA